MLEDTNSLDGVQLYDWQIEQIYDFTPDKYSTLIASKVFQTE